MDMVDLFRGNPDVVGLDDETGEWGGEPRPLRLDPEDRHVQWHALWDAHVAGTQGIGIYPYNHHEAGVAWGCVDFDEGELDSWSHALDLWAGLRAVGIESFIERSRSKGYHVWLFSSGWVQARIMRRLLIGACVAVEVPHKEVNPKSERLGLNQLGNFVRLPYKAAGVAYQPSTVRQVIVDQLGTPVPMEVFYAAAIEAAVPPRRLGNIAKRMQVNERQLQPSIRTYDGPWKHQLNALGRMQLSQGPKPGEDRSSYLYAFGLACSESGLTQEDVATAVRVADYVHTQKYTHRPDADARYSEIARKATHQPEAS